MRFAPRRFVPRSRSAIPFVFLLALTLSPLRPAGAQAELLGFLKNVTDIGIFGSTGQFVPRSSQVEGRRSGYQALGFELSFGVGALTCPAEIIARKDAPPHHHYRSAGPDSVRRCVKNSAANDNASSRRMVARDTSPGGGGQARKMVAPRDTSWLFEFALGYTQISGFKSRNPLLDMRGSVREAPMASVYATKENAVSWSPVDFYVGIRSGFIQLQNFRAYADTTVASAGSTTSSNVYSGTASSFLSAVALGLTTDVGPTSWFIEGAYSWRNFPGIEWTGQGKLLPKVLPRSLNLSGTTLSVGIQIPINASKGGG